MGLRRRDELISLQAFLLRRLFALPPAVLRVLSGKRAIERDGQRLAADVQLVLHTLALRGHRSPIDRTPFAAARAAHAAATEVFRADPPSLWRITDTRMPLPTGDLSLRWYQPRDTKPGPLLVYFHGGGFVFGDLDTHDGVCRRLARDADLRVLAVDYRLAPEHPFPAAIDDAEAAFRWVVANAHDLGADPARIGVGGDSAGGNLAAVVAQRCLRAGRPMPACQFLLYPVTDLRDEHPSYERFATGFYFDAATMRRMRALYLPDPPRAHEPDASPLHAPSLQGLPPAFVATAGFDILLDDGEAYADALAAAGVAVVRRCFHDQVHGFAGTASLFPSAARAMREVAVELRRLFSTASRS